VRLRFNDQGKGAPQLARSATEGSELEQLVMYQPHCAIPKPVRDNQANAN